MVKLKPRSFDPARAPVGEADEVGLGLLGHLESAGVEEVTHGVGVNPVVDDGVFVLGREDEEDDNPAGGDKHEVAQVFQGVDLCGRRYGRGGGLVRHWRCLGKVGLHVWGTVLCRDGRGNCSMGGEG